MLRSGAIYDLLFRFRNIDLDNINDIYFAINIIIIIATTLLKAFIAPFIFELIIVIVINVDIVVIVIIIIIIVISERFIVKFIVFDFDIKRRFAMSASFNKSQNLMIVKTFDGVLLRINDDISLF